MTIILFFAILVVLILVHEFGHFIVAKKSGIRVDEFGIGFPPKIYGKKFGETEYTVNWLPLGGFVKIWGEDPTDADYQDTPENTRSFVAQPRYIQAAVLVAGVAMNILFAFLLYVVAYWIGMPTHVEENVPLSEYSSVELFVTGVLENSPAFETLKPNDEILALHTTASTLTKESGLTPKAVSEFISSSDGGTVTFDILRRGEPLAIEIQPEQGVLEDRPEVLAAGFSMSLVGIQDLSFFEAVIQASKRTTQALVDITLGLVTLLTGAFTGTSDFSQISGPVGIIGLVGDAAALGFIWILTFSAFISLNLAVINLFPFPALDGGRLVFVLIESIIRRPIKPILATRLNQFGMIALLTLMAIVTIQDVLKLF